MDALDNPRELRGLEIAKAKESQISRIDPATYNVLSQSGNGEMDDETRFWIAQEVAETKYKHDARTLFALGKKLMGKKPMTIITDGLSAYHEAYKKEFWTLKGQRTEHIRHITVRGDRNNNKMERLNGEIRDREKVMRGLKKTDTPIVSGYQIFHNYIREHEGLEGKTPAEACGIKIE